jgi:hypothetical protein
MGQRSLQTSLIGGIDSPKPPYSGRMCRLGFRLEICNLSNYNLASNALSSSKSWLLILGSGRQSRKFTRVMTSSLYTITVDTASNHGLQSPGYFWLEANSASATIQGGFSPTNPMSYSHMHSKFPYSGGNIPIRMPYVKYEGKSTVCNTRWPGIRIKRALARNFPYLRYEVCTDVRIGSPTLNRASTR